MPDPLVQFTTCEGGIWHQVPLSTAKKFKVAALRYGDYIYDYVLAELGHNPIRRCNFPTEGD